MLLSKVVKSPHSLNAAKSEFGWWAAYQGYEFVGAVRAYWQESLFGGADAYVEAEVRKHGNKETAKEARRLVSV